MQDAARSGREQLLDPFVPHDLRQPGDRLRHHIDVLRLVRVRARGHVGAFVEQLLRRLLGRPAILSHERANVEKEMRPGLDERREARRVLPYRRVPLGVSHDGDEARAMEVEEPVVRAQREPLGGELDEDAALRPGARSGPAVRRGEGVGGGAGERRGRGAPRRDGCARRRRRRRSVRSTGTLREGGPRRGRRRGGRASLRTPARGSPGRCRTSRGACGASPSRPRSRPAGARARAPHPPRARARRRRCRRPSGSASR